MEVDKFVGIVTYNRAKHIGEIVESVLSTCSNGTRVAVCDDGSTDNTAEVLKEFPVTYIRGKNLGVAHNKNRALYLGQHSTFLAIIEDDLKPIKEGWFELYERAAKLSGIHHFCRVQDKEVPETIPAFSQFMQAQGLDPVFGSSPRGDCTFITSKVINHVGGFNPQFMGVGYAHGEWTERCVKAGLIPHPQKYVDVREARDCFIQVGDTEGGRWERPKEEIDLEIQQNRNLIKRLQNTEYIYHPLVLN